VHVSEAPPMYPPPASGPPPSAPFPDEIRQNTQKMLDEQLKDVEEWAARRRRAIFV
jgi:hypothetical protein